MKIIKTLVLLFIAALTIQAQQADFNLIEISNYQWPEGCNDIWGYVDTNGVEYALVGTKSATAVVSLEDPSNPIERAYIPGVNSTWRDLKTWGHYAYCIADVGDDGLLIIDMSGAPDNITHNYLNVGFNYNGSPETIRKCHNVFIDENGIMYLSGCNSGSDGVLMFDLNDDPENPKFLGAENASYSHDNVVRGDTLWSSDLSNGFSVWDVSDKSNPVELARQRTSSNFTHNAWFSDDNNYLFTTDERGDAYMDAYDVSDLNDIKFLDNYRPKSTEGRGVIPHNAHFVDGYLVTSWYTDGVKIIDGNKPDNLIEVGSFDSFMGPDGGFNGCWGAYPWLPSGLILINDIQTGLYVLEPNYQRACYLEGVVTDAVGGAPISDVEITIESSFINEVSTDFTGEYKTGQAEAGSFDVTFSHPDYIDQTIEVNLENGEVTRLDVQMNSRPFFTVTGMVIDAITKEPVANADLFFTNQIDEYVGQANATGLFSVPVYEDISNPDFQIIAGAWGYNYTVLDGETIDDNIQLTIELEFGYQDDFLFDYGWIEEGTAPRGKWERGLPNGTTVNGSIANPASDVDSDLGEICFVTGNANGGGAGDDDVDDGYTVLISPYMDLTDYVEPILTYRSWFFNGSRPNPNDSFMVQIDNGIDLVTLEVIRQSGSTWNDTSRFELADYIELTDSVQIMVQVSDDQADGHISEGGFDEFRVVDEFSTDIDITSESNWSITPTLAHDQVRVHATEINGTSARIFDANGKSIQEISFNGNQETIDVTSLNPGVYFIKIRSEKGKTEVLSFTKI